MHLVNMTVTKLLLFTIILGSPIKVKNGQCREIAFFALKSIIASTYKSLIHVMRLSDDYDLKCTKKAEPFMTLLFIFGDLGIHVIPKNGYFIE